MGPQPLPSYVAGAICGTRLWNSEFQVLNFEPTFQMALTSLRSACNMYKSTIPKQISHFKFTILSYLEHLCISTPTLHSGGRRECTHSLAKNYRINFKSNTTCISNLHYSLLHPYTIPHTSVCTFTVVTFNASNDLTYMAFNKIQIYLV